MADVGFDRVVAVAGLDIGEVDADHLEQCIGGVAEELQVAMLGHVAVVVDPGGVDLGIDQTQRPGRVQALRRAAALFPKPLLEIGEQLAGTPAFAAVAGLQGMHDTDEVFVPDSFEFADGATGGLRVRLCPDLLDKRVVEIDHVGEFRPGPFEAGAELGEEVPHARFAAGDAISLEETHLAQRMPKE